MHRSSASLQAQSHSQSRQSGWSESQIWEGEPALIRADSLSVHEQKAPLGVHA